MAITTKSVKQQTPKNPRERAQERARHLLESWKLEPTEDQLKRWSKHILSLANRYDNYCLEHEEENENRSNPDSKEPPIEVRRELLDYISQSAFHLFKALHYAKVVHPKFMENYLNFSLNIYDNSLLTHLMVPEEEFNTIPIMQALEMLTIKASLEASVHAEAGSAPLWKSFLFGHPTHRLLVDCIIELAWIGIEDPLGKLDEFAEAVHYVAFPKEGLLPGLDDYSPGIKHWWNEEGQAIYSTALPLPTSGNLEDRATNVLQKIMEIVADNDRGESGGIYPDPRILRKRKSNKKISKNNP